jgi:hypothetical protein
MPAGPLIAAFGSSQQTAISQLANAYCSEMMASTALRDAFFGSGLDANLPSNVSWFGGSGSAQRQIVINALVTNAVGAAHPQIASQVQTEIDGLITRIPAANANATVSQTTVAACTAVLGSAAVTLQ